MKTSSILIIILVFATLSIHAQTPFSVESQPDAKQVNVSIRAGLTTSKAIVFWRRKN